MDNKKLNLNPNTVLALGDSYTIGEGVTDSDRWPNQFIHQLQQKGIYLELQHLVAKTGWTTAELLTELENFNFDQCYGLVTLLIGVNNQYRGQPLDLFRVEFRRLLNLAIDKAEGKTDRTIVLSIPDWGVTPFANNRDRKAIAKEIDAYNDVKQEETELAKAVFVDISDVSGRKGLQDGWLAEDNLHPSGKMYHQWAIRAAETWLKEFDSPEF